MSKENVEIVRSQFENVNARDFAAVMDAYADDVVLALHGQSRILAASGGAVGKEAVGKWFGEWFKTFDPDYRFEIEESRDLGDRVLIVATHHTRGRSSGVPVTLRAWWVYTVCEGKVVRCDSFSSRAEALEVAGLAE